MIRFENLVLEVNSKTKSHKILYSSLETFLTLIVWLASLYFCARFVLAPLALSNIGGFKREINFAIYLILFSFLIPLTFLILWRGFIIGLKPLSIFNFGINFRFWLFLIGFTISTIIVLGSNIIANENNIELIKTRFSGFDFKQILILLAVYLLAFAVQSSFEEAFFRGAIVQNLRSFGAHIFIAIGISAMIFALFHLNSKTSPNIFFAVFIMGICFSISTFRTGGIEAAMGAHIANNFITGALFGHLDNSQNGENVILLSILFLILYLGLLEIFLWLARRFWGQNFTFIRT